MGGGLYYGEEGGGGGPGVGFFFFFLKPFSWAKVWGAYFFFWQKLKQPWGNLLGHWPKLFLFSIF